MSRLPRHASRIKPPLRGRAATKHYRGEFAPITSTHHPLKPPYSSQTLPKEPKPSKPPHLEKPITPEPSSPTNNSLYSDLFNFYKKWIWLIALAAVLIGLLLFN